MDGSIDLISVYVFAGAFLALAPTLLLCRFLWKKPPWWLILLLVVFIGWGAWFMLVASYYDYAWALIDSQDNPDPEFVDETAADGGPLMAAVLGGWLVSLLYFLIWWIVFLMARGIRSMAMSGGRNTG